MTRNLLYVLLCVVAVLVILWLIGVGVHVG